MTRHDTIPDSPQDTERAIEAFFAHVGVRPGGGTLAALGEVTEAFSRLPYENLSKILKTTGDGGPEVWRRRPLEVMEDHLAHGLGGTCYALTHFLRAILTRLGQSARPVLADMPQAPDRHCALVIEQNGLPYLLDPGYLINEPVRLPDDVTRLVTPRGELTLRRDHATGRVDLLSGDSDVTQRLHYSLKPLPVDDETFIARWRDSFAWPQMNQILITRHVEGGQLYLHNRHLRRIGQDGVQAKTLAREDLVRGAAEAFGIDPRKISAARELLNTRRPVRKL